MMGRRLDVEAMSIKTLSVFSLCLFISPLVVCAHSDIYVPIVVVSKEIKQNPDRAFLNLTFPTDLISEGFSHRQFNSNEYSWHGDIDYILNIWNSDHDDLIVALESETISFRRHITSETTGSLLSSINQIETGACILKIKNGDDLYVKDPFQLLDHSTPNHELRFINEAYVKDGLAIIYPDSEESG